MRYHFHVKLILYSDVTFETEDFRVTQLQAKAITKHELRFKTHILPN